MLHLRLRAVLSVLALMSCAEDHSGSSGPDVPSTVAVNVSPKAQVITANGTFLFSVAVTPASNADRLACTVEPASIGTVSMVPTGCRLLASSTVAGGRLIATVGTKSDTASLLVFVGNSAR